MGGIRKLRCVHDCRQEADTDKGGDRLVNTAEHDVTWTNDRIKEYWDWLSRCPWATRLEFANVAGDALVNLVQTVFPVRGNICDFGAGRNGVLKSIVGAKANISGIWATEFSGRAAGIVTEKFAGVGSFRGCVMVEDGHVPLDSDCFDMVFLTEVIEHLSDTQANIVLPEIRRLLKRGGAIVVTTPNNEQLVEETMRCPECGCLYHKWQHVKSFTQESLCEVMYSIGFAMKYCQVVDILDYNQYTLFQHVLRRLTKRLTNSGLPNLVYLGVKT